MSNKRKVCKHCREYFDAEGMIKVPAGTFCTFPHVALWLAEKNRKDAEKQHKQQKRQHRADKAEFKANDRSKQLALAQKAFNSFIRYRDRECDCISCGRPTKPAQSQAGHYRSVGAAPHLRFNQFNNNKQCVQCNLHKSGNAVDYRINLVKKIGVESVERIEEENSPKKWTISEIRSIGDYYKRLLKRLQLLA